MMALAATTYPGGVRSSDLEPVLAAPGGFLAGVLVAGLIGVIAAAWRRRRRRDAASPPPPAAGTATPELATLLAENNVLARLNRMQAEFVAVASHELKTPLTSICAYTEVLLQHAAESRFAHSAEFLGVIKEEAERLLRMVNRILDFSRLEFGQRPLVFRPVALGSLVRQTVRTLQPLAESKGLRLEDEYSADLPPVDVDPDLVKQALINLANNAIKFTPAGGAVQVSVREGAATLQVSVRDNGPGIPRRELRRIFRQFYRLGGRDGAAEGVGLGLTIVKNIVNLHQGRVEVHSREGEGTTFSFHLPKVMHFPPVTTALLDERGDQPPLRQILSLCVRMAAELLGARAVALLLPGPEGEDLVIPAALGYAEEWLAKARLPLHGGPIGRALASGEPVTLAATEVADPLAAAGGLASPHALAATPLRRGPQVLGVMAVARKLGEEPFDADDLRFLGTVGEKISAALQLAARPDLPPRDLDRVVDALQSLALLRQSAIPTANPLALRLLARTCEKLGLERAEVKRLLFVAVVHDAGMVRVSEDILLKAETLSPDERGEVDRHPEEGADLLSLLLPRPEMGEIILSHHERVDGGGYPAGRRGGEIPLGSRIVAVVDAFFAMTVSRPYREGRTAEAAAAEMQTHAGTQFDAQVLATFLKVLQEEGMLGESAADRDDSRPVAAPEGTRR
jgi:signal transduction histidine kinase